MSSGEAGEPCDALLFSACRASEPGTTVLVSERDTVGGFMWPMGDLVD
jgi:hypothetical protein